MANLINWFEIPAANFERAISFYKSILNIEINENKYSELKWVFRLMRKRFRSGHLRWRL